MAIPFTSLRFPAAGEQVWGINFGRRVRRIEEKTHWVPVPREYSFLRLSLAGRLVGLHDIAPRRRVQITPFVSSRRIKDDPEAQPATESDFGLDVSVGLSSNLTADVALNPRLRPSRSGPGAGSTSPASSCGSPRSAPSSSKGSRCSARTPAPWTSSTPAASVSTRVH